MRHYYIILLALSILVITGCSKEEVEPVGHLSYDNNEYELEYGAIQDFGTNDDITYRTYSINLGSAKETPKDFISFSIRSNSTKRLEEGVYEYAYYYGKGNFSSIRIGIDIEYDSSNEKVGGITMTESNSDFEGTLTVSQEDGDYKFEFDIEVTNDDQTFNITGEFHDVLNDEYVYF